MFELVVLSGSLSSFVVSFWGLASRGTQSDLASRKQSSKVQFRAYNFCLASFAGSEKATSFIVFFAYLASVGVCCDYTSILLAIATP